MKVRIRLVSGDINVYISSLTSLVMSAGSAPYMSCTCGYSPGLGKVRPKEDVRVIDKIRVEHGGMQTQFKTDGKKIGLNIANFFSIKPTDALCSKFYFYIYQNKIWNSVHLLFLLKRILVRCTVI